MKTYYIPEGIVNIGSIFPSIDLSEIIEWTITLKDEDQNIIATSRVNKICNCCGVGKVRIHFINSCGMLDSLNFINAEVKHNVKSNIWRRPKLYNDDITMGGNYRNDIKSNETTEAEINILMEENSLWINELKDTPMAWVEEYLPSGFKEQKVKAFIPIVIKDISHHELKNTQRYSYNVKILFERSNDNITFR